MNKTKVKILVAILIIVTIVTIVICINFNNTNTSNQNNHITGDLIACEILNGYSEQNKYDLKNVFIKSYGELQEYVNQFDEMPIYINDNMNDINVLAYFDENYFKNHTLAIFEYDGTFTNKQYEIKTVTRTGNNVHVNVDLIVYPSGGVLAENLGFYFISLDRDIQSVDFNINRTEIKNSNPFDVGVDYKPVIYLYPTEETVVNIKLGYEDAITCTYPNYNQGWTVSAKPNGDLIDLATGRYQYSLYYESHCLYPYAMTDEGFVVAKEDTVAFLEEKLAILGLTEREANEFIIYWLPQLESNKYNYIRFATTDEIEKNMPITISPTPDSVIRIRMLFKGLDGFVVVNEQVLTTPDRTGFTVVEWGGSIL